MSKKSLFVLLIFFVILVLAVSVGCILKFQEKEIARLEDQIQYLEEEFVPMKFEILEKKNSDISVAIKYYDMNGKEVGASKLVKLSGNELNFDFEVIKFSEKARIFFPSGVYTDTMAQVDETAISGDYEKNGFPAIYEGMKLYDKDGNPLDEEGVEQVRTQLSDYFAVVRKRGAVTQTEQHGVAVHDLKSISEFKKGFVYKVVCHPHSGGIEIVKMK